MNNIFVCHICTEDHTTENYQSLLGLRAIYKSGETLVKQLGDLGNLEINQHIRIHRRNPHPIIIPTNNLNNGTLQVCRTGHPNTLLLLLILHKNSIGHKGGGDNPTPNHHLYLHLITHILITQPIPNNFYHGLCLQFPLLHNNLITSKIQNLHDLHCYLHNRYIIQIISQLKLLTTLSCKLFHPTLFRLYLYTRYNCDLEEL